MDVLAQAAADLEAEGNRLLRLAAMFREINGEPPKRRRRRRKDAPKLKQVLSGRGGAPAMTLRTQTVPRLSPRDLEGSDLAYTTEGAA